MGEAAPPSRREASRRASLTADGREQGAREQRRAGASRRPESNAGRERPASPPAPDAPDTADESGRESGIEPDVDSPHGEEGGDTLFLQQAFETVSHDRRTELGEERAAEDTEENGRDGGLPDQTPESAVGQRRSQRRGGPGPVREEGHRSGNDPGRETRLRAEESDARAEALALGDPLPQNEVLRRNRAGDLIVQYAEKTPGETAAEEERVVPESRSAPPHPIPRDNAEDEEKKSEHPEGVGDFEEGHRPHDTTVGS